MTSSDAQERLERILTESSGVVDSRMPGATPTLADRRRLHRRGRLRWRISLRALTTTALCLVALLGVWWVVTATASSRSAPDSPSAGRSSVAPLRAASPAPSSIADTPAAAGTSASIVVHVSGAVRHPGIVRLPAGARVFQALEKTGGALDTAELDALNLAEPLQDGRKVHVPRHGDSAAAPASGQVGDDGNAGTSQTASVRLNTASEEQLMTLPRVGKVLARRIIAWREQHGPFTRIEDLDAVDGIGPRLLEQLTPLIVLDG